MRPHTQIVHAQYVMVLQLGYASGAKHGHGLVSSSVATARPTRLAPGGQDMKLVRDGVSTIGFAKLDTSYSHMCRIISDGNAKNSMCLTVECS